MATVHPPKLSEAQLGRGVPEEGVQPASPATELAKGETKGSQSRHPLRYPGFRAIKLAQPLGQGQSHQERRISAPLCPPWGGHREGNQGQAYDSPEGS